MASVTCKKLRGGELGLERKRDSSTEREREEGSQINGNLHRLPTIYSGSGA
jgi:hypothetical protein